MADFVPELVNPNDPDSVAEWARAINSVVNGRISVGEPISADTTMFPNGVKGHLLGSFCQATVTANGAAHVFTHNLNVEPKGLTAPPAYNDPLNVCWVVSRVQITGGAPGAGGGCAAMFHGGAGTIDANSITLDVYISGHVPAPANPAIVTLWFFPTTR